ncbi:6054_t:CDS:2 [Racocetra fulgida]|uniref:6054_t:CDS:1 n=1 Tax=Racocetra fulgida TaxID=60492 RepID=A0A9N9F400_9GLOM|nr:6054_t:CDS:2 [Racocetra fulgida]
MTLLEVNAQDYMQRSGSDNATISRIDLIVVKKIIELHPRITVYNFITVEKESCTSSSLTFAGHNTM